MEGKEIVSIIVFILLLGACSTKDVDSVQVNITSFEDYQSGIVKGIDINITEDKCACSFMRDSTDVFVDLDESVSKKLWVLADSIFLNESASMYSYWKKTDSCEFDEGDLLSIVVSRNGTKRYLRPQFGDIYYNSQELQLTEDYHEYIYSNTFRLFLQYIDLVHAYALGQEAWSNYVDDVHKMSRDPKANVFSAILQACDTTKIFAVRLEQSSDSEDDRTEEETSSLPMIPHYDDEDEQFFIRKQDSVFIAYGSDLHYMYKCKFSKMFPDYDSFKSAIVNENKHGLSKSICCKMNHVYYDESFSIDNTILQYYKKNGVQSIVDSFCVVKKDILGFKNMLDTQYDARRTIAFLMWMNGYYFNYDGISGEEYLRPIAETDQ